MWWVVVAMQVIERCLERFRMAVPMVDLKVHGKIF
jgi:hypothetical protein